MRIFIFGLVVVFMATSCSHGSSGMGNGPSGAARSLDSLHFTVEEAPEWSDLFKRRSGWFGGDGIFAATKDGNEAPGAAGKSETSIWFSDTMLGDIVGDSLKPGYEMIHNSVALLSGGVPDSDHIHFYWKSEANKNASLFKPATPATQKGEYYWLGDGFVDHQKNKDLYIFGYRVKDISDSVAFGFKVLGSTLIIVPAGGQAPFPDYRQVDIPFFSGKDMDSTGSFGAGIYVNTAEAGARNPDGYVYIYGVRGKAKNLMIARVEPSDIENFSKWTFWDGHGWNNDVSKIATVADRLSNELGVMQLKDGRYALVFQEDGWGRNVALRLSSTPYGPFGALINIYDCSKDLAAGEKLYAYNAKVHPVLSAPDELLVSYNVNSFDFFKDIKAMPNLYRPRFIRVKVLP